MTEPHPYDLKRGEYPDCGSKEWWWGPEGGMTTMYRSPCGLWAAVSPFGAKVVDHEPNRWFNPHAKCLLGCEKGTYLEAKVYDLDNDYDPCGRPFCRKCQGYHTGRCEGVQTIIDMGGWCYRHETHHGPRIAELEKADGNDER